MTTYKATKRTTLTFPNNLAAEGFHTEANLVKIVVGSNIEGDTVTIDWDGTAWAGQDERELKRLVNDYCATSIKTEAINARH